MGCRQSKNLPPKPVENDVGVDIPSVGVYSFQELTNHLHPGKIVGGSVYLVKVPKVTVVNLGESVSMTTMSMRVGSLSLAVKHARLESAQDSRRMGHEIRTTYKQLQHPNIAKPLGCCIHGTQVLIVYNYLDNQSLHHALFGGDGGLRSQLSWGKRFKICVQIAKALNFLHEDSGLGIHGNLKPTNLLLDDDLNAVVTDLPYGKLLNQTIMLQNSIPVDRGYMAPEYLQGLPMTTKSDVYSFGLVMLEIITGHRHVTGKTIMLLNKATKYHEDGNLGALVDANLQKCEDYKHYEAVFMLHLAMQCVSQSFDVRPSMSEIVEILRGKKEFKGNLITTSPSLQHTSELVIAT